MSAGPPRTDASSEPGPRSFERRFDLDGCPVTVRGVGLAHLPLIIDRLLGPYLVDERAAPSTPTRPSLSPIVVDLAPRHDTPRMPDEGPTFLFPPLLAFAVEATAADGTRDGGWRLVDDVGELWVRPREGRVTGTVRQDASLAEFSRFAGLTIWVALIECLRARGRYPLHGAALVDEQGVPVMLAGTKGAGKSTATLALVESGWTVLTDDTVFIERAPAPDQPGRLSLIGYAKRFHVRNDLAARRPDLADLVRDPPPFEPQDKKWLALDERYPDRLARRSGPPARLYFPEIVDEPRSRLVPLGQRDALLLLLRHSPFVFLRPELASDHLDVLRAISDGARAARVLCGRDLLAEPSLYATLLGAEALARAITALDGTTASSPPLAPHPHHTAADRTD